MTGPGVELPRFKDIDALADKFEDKLEDLASVKEKLTEFEQKIADAMIDHGVTTYSYRDRVVTLKAGKTRVKIKTVKAKSPTVRDGEDADA